MKVAEQKVDSCEMETDSWHIALRALEPEDLELVYRIENDERLWSSSGDSQHVSHYTVRQYLVQQKSDIYQDGELRLVIVADGQPVGLVDLTDFSAHHLRAEVGIVVLSAYHRQGVATAALRQLADYANNRLHLRSLHAYVSTLNAPAQALFNSLGYQSAGILQRWIEGRQSATLYELLL